MEGNIPSGVSVQPAAFTQAGTALDDSVRGAARLVAAISRTADVRNAVHSQASIFLPVAVLPVMEAGNVSVGPSSHLYATALQFRVSFFTLPELRTAFRNP